MSVATLAPLTATCPRCAGRGHRKAFMDSTPEPCARCDGSGVVRAIPLDHTSPALEAWVEAHRNGIVPPVAPAKFKGHAVRLTNRGRERIERDWAEAIARATERPGSWLDAMAYDAAKTTGHDAVDIARCWGLTR